MSLRFMDSFSHYATAQLPLKWFSASSYAGIAAGGRWGSGCLQLGGGSVVWQAASAQPTWTVGVAFQCVVAADERPIAILDSGTVQIDVRRDNSTGYLSVTRNGTVLATGATATSLGLWYYLELQATINSTTGSYTLRINGVTELTATNVNTQATGNASANQVRISAGGNYGAFYSWFDDVYICDGMGSVNNTFLGDVRIQALLPTSDGANHAWTPSSGSDHYPLVNEVPPDGDTSYVGSSTVGQVDEYGMTTIAVSTGTVAGVQTLLYARKDDAGTRTIAPVVREGGTDYVGTAVSLGTSYAYFPQIYEQDPATSAAWTIAGIGADSFGVKLVS
jgi:hypothetical protein